MARPVTPGLLAGGRGRWHLQLSATPGSSARPGPFRSTSPSSAWPAPLTARATGSWPPMAASSTTAMPFYGSAGGIPLNKPIVGMAPTPDGKGYWLVASDGGIFSYGDAGFFGSAGGIHLNKPIVGMAPTPDGRGLLAGGLRRWHLQLRRCEFLRLDRLHPPQPADRRHGCNARWCRLLVRGL